MLDKLAKSLLKTINPSLIIVLGVYTVVWGFWIANPFWTVFTQAALYQALEQAAPFSPELFWGGIAMVAGGFIIRGAVKPSYKNLQWGSFVGFFHWFVIGIMYLMGDWANTGGITSLAFAVYAAIIWLNVKVNKRSFQD